VPISHPLLQSCCCGRRGTSIASSRDPLIGGMKAFFTMGHPSTGSPQRLIKRLYVNCVFSPAVSRHGRCYIIGFCGCISASGRTRRMGSRSPERHVLDRFPNNCRFTKSADQGNLIRYVTPTKSNSDFYSPLHHLGFNMVFYKSWARLFFSVPFCGCAFPHRRKCDVRNADAPREKISKG